MKKIVLLLLGLVAFSGFAQQKNQSATNQPVKPLAEKYTDQMKDMLTLTLKQETKIKALYEEHLTKYPETNANAQEVKKENAEFDTKLKGVLTAEQFEKWQYIREHPMAAGFKAGTEKGKKG
ncbi:hypothetical protein ACLI1A_00525 [Flavobacterium sp. RHBU_3]|uniref:hypothetical protein n=1 Tax=Flavobacterium sp. RHBU_3 TaxID=3391184 RepID=UPI003984F37E